MLLPEDKKELDTIGSLVFHSIGKCDKHLKYYKGRESSLIIKVSELGYGR